MIKRTTTNCTRKGIILLLCHTLLMTCEHCCSSSTVIPLATLNTILAGEGDSSSKIKVTEHDLGRGFKFNVKRGDNPIKGHVFRGDLEISPITTSTQVSSVVQDFQSFEDSFEIAGKVTLPLFGFKGFASISAEAKYFKKIISTKKTITLVYRSRHTAYYRRHNPTTLQSTKEVQDIMHQNPDSFGDTFGTQFIDTIVYGAQLEVSFTMTSSSSTDIDIVSLAFTLKILFIKIKFNLEFGSEDLDSFFGMNITANIIGVPHKKLSKGATFKDTVEFINNFNTKYEELYRNYNVNNSTLLDEIEPVGLVLSSSNDVMDVMKEDEALVFEKKIDQLGKVFQHVSYWQAKLNRIKEDLKDPYKKDDRLRTEMYNPYIKQWQQVMDKLDDKVSECAEFLGLSISEIIKDTTVVPDLYPKPASQDDDLIRGLSGEQYIPSPVEFENREPLRDTYYIGYAIRDEVTGEMKPWMRGVLKRTHDDYSIADDMTPEKLYRKAISYKDVKFAPGCTSGSALTMQECKDFAEEKGDYKIEVGYWDDFPSGCIKKRIKENNSHTHFYYNTNHANGRARKREGEEFISVCRVAPFITDSFTQMAPGIVSECPSGTALSSKECMMAGMAFGAALRDGGVVEGQWDNAPSGCFVNPGEDNVVHYNSNAKGRGGNGRYSVLCLKAAGSLAMAD